ncbi:hypothetical protein N0V90_009553 [Kalmusia sp. IMI 367209]|nr:hypothetical protein N0V90_009553 [Kalmusia sp. IMI 367209]
MAMVHKINVTPTGVTFNGPDPEAKNRILRRFPNHTEYFMRVQFCDEDGTDLRFNSRLSNEEIYRRFKKIMTEGIAVGGRVYGFLGFSHSSLRSHSAWFMAPFVYDEAFQTYFTVISNLGKFDNIRSPARCAARIGQAFSETPFAISLEKNGIQHGKLLDVKTEDGSHVFSDGVGTLSRAVVESICANIPRGKSATCFQIRWGGAKGMLALDARLEGSTINVRDSMVKFESADIQNLEICDVANKPIPMVLNRQMIKILEDLGLPDIWFLEQQSTALYRLQLVTAHISNTVSFLESHTIADRVGFPQLIRQLESIGVNYKRDRFLRSVVETAVLRELRLLKYKARIPIQHGVTLFGIMDETGYLEEGEVFVTFEKASFISCQATDIDNRPMLITRSPALHPGDIQVATNIIPPSHHPLRALKNCIVFSRKGTRDLPSCLSGGDLDGDTYGIIWDEAAVAGCQHVFEPAEYPRTNPLDIGRIVERKDMTDFFINFMATDQLGLIATRHMILADQRKEGTNDPDCKTLAELHSTGVDYSKTGVPVDIETFKKIRTNRYRPHFLAPSEPTHIKDKIEIDFDAVMRRPIDEDEEDEDDNIAPRYLYYRSDNINGKLFDAIDERKIWYQNIKDKGKLDDFVWSDLLKYIVGECKVKLGKIDWNHMIVEALGIRHAYEDAIYNATLDFSDHATRRITEIEVFTGTIFNVSGVQTRRQRDRSLRLKDEFDRIVRWAETLIRKRTTRNDDKQNGDGESSEDPNKALVLSIACLDISRWTESRSFGFKSGRSYEEFQSFKVISACCAIRELNAAVRRLEGYKRDLVYLDPDLRKIT